jgi:SepF-like predicted cell division protein (DUF552 family)
MNRDSFGFLIPIFPFCHFSEFFNFNNQTSENKLLVSDFPSVRVEIHLKRVVEKQRNLALNAHGKIVLADDDEVFRRF